ncbi:MAG: hypothetical protein M1834_008255 [Cirrosporium novae-zelandiae]|nr:MAG: hypothetical protein M1834_008255 [Cirrosporium novae-zelandiae]
MGPTIHLVRHAQGWHNLEAGVRDDDPFSLPDPDLTPEGESQCLTLMSEFPYHSRISLLVASPIRRTIYTALLGFSPEIKRGMRILTLPEAQETSDLPCDTGSDPEVLLKEFKDKPVDLELVEPGWNSKKGKWAPTKEALEERAKWVRKWLQAKTSGLDEDTDVVMVTHGGFLHYLTEDWNGFGQFEGTGWSNTEFRSYNFASTADAEENPHFAETQESIQRRTGNNPELTDMEKIELKLTRDEEEERHEQAVPVMNGTAKI